MEGWGRTLLNFRTRVFLFWKPANTYFRFSIYNHVHCVRSNRVTPLRHFQSVLQCWRGKNTRKQLQNASSRCPAPFSSTQHAFSRECTNQLSREFSAIQYIYKNGIGSLRRSSSFASLTAFWKRRVMNRTIYLTRWRAVGKPKYVFIYVSEQRGKRRMRKNRLRNKLLEKKKKKISAKTATRIILQRIVREPKKSFIKNPPETNEKGERKRQR